MSIAVIDKPNSMNTKLLSIGDFSDLEVYKLANRLSMNVFQLTLDFPKEEKHALIDQLRRSSREAAVHVAKGWGNRAYEMAFEKYLMEAVGSAEETKSWLGFAVNCSYMSVQIHQSLEKQYRELIKELFKLSENWRTL